MTKEEKIGFEHAKKMALIYTERTGNIAVVLAVPNFVYGYSWFSEDEYLKKYRKKKVYFTTVTKQEKSTRCQDFCKGDTKRSNRRWFGSKDYQ